MPLKLVATGKFEESMLELELGDKVRLGRAPRHGWKIGWDRKISREHADIEVNEDSVIVRQLGTARNPIFHDGREIDELEINPGQRFRIGDTEFQLLSAESVEHESLLVERAFGDAELAKYSFGESEIRLEALSRLPDMVAAAKTDEEFAAKLVELLLYAINPAEAASVVRFDGVNASGETKLSTIRWDARNDLVRLKPSRRLIAAAVNSKQTLLHVWSAEEAGSDPSFTFSAGLDWAICVPILSDCVKGWCLYLSGVSSDEANASSTVPRLAGDIRFAELVARFVGSILEMQTLQKRHLGLSQFFSPAILETLNETNSDTLLSPKQSDVSILFCDLRGFSRRAESADDLPLLLERVSAALSVMTRGVMRYEGAIADFQGDAALGFWGWPNPLEEGPLPACQAAMAIWEEFSHSQKCDDHPLCGFNVGIGIGHGNAIAGKIGPPEQTKIGVFGSVVNLASRLEGLTKQFRVPIIIDAKTAEHIRRQDSREKLRVRHLGIVQPAGMSESQSLYQLLPPASPLAQVTEAMISLHESGVSYFIDGRWDKAIDAFQRLPVEDRAKDLLVYFMARHEHKPPADWDGVLKLEK